MIFLRMARAPSPITIPIGTSKGHIWQNPRGAIEKEGRPQQTAFPAFTARQKRTDRRRAARPVR